MNHKWLKSLNLILGWALTEESANVARRIASKGASAGEGRILVVAKDFPVQDKALTDGLSSLIPLYGKLAKRIAVVGSSSALQRLQVKRLVGSNAALFLYEQDAEDWLFKD